MHLYVKKLRDKCGDFWWYSLLMFLACRSGDAVQAFIGLWLVPKFVPQNELGAALPILQVGSVFGLPMAILVVPFSRWLTIYSARGERGKIKRLLSITFCGVVVAFLLAAVIAKFLLPMVFDRISIVNGSLGLLMICVGLIGPFSSVFSNALQGLKRFGAMAFIQFLGAPFRLAVMLVAMPFRALSGYMLGQAAGPALSVAFSCWSLRKELGKDVKSEKLGREDCHAMFKYTLPISVYITLGILLGAWQTLLFRQRLPEIESAAFYMISRLGEVAAYAALALMAIAFPLAVEETHNNQEKGKSILGKLLMGSLGAGLAVSAVLLLFGSKILAILPSGRDYVPYSSLMVVYALRISFSAACGAFFSFETAAGRFSFLWYWVPITLFETGSLVVLSGYGAFNGILPISILDWMASFRATRLCFYVWWLFALSLVQLAVIAIHLSARKYFQKR